MDGGRDIFSGSNVRHTIVPINLQGGGFIAETQTWNRPVVLSSNKVIINLVRALIPFSMSVDRQGVAWVVYSNGELFRLPFAARLLMNV